jgi:hypothetical protein
MALLNLFMSLAIVVIAYRGVERARAEGRGTVDPALFIFFAVVILVALLTPALLLLWTNRGLKNLKRLARRWQIALSSLLLFAFLNPTLAFAARLGQDPTGFVKLFLGICFLPLVAQALILYFLLFSSKTKAALSR